MATFSDLTSDVMTITNRPDLIAETKLAVKAATLKIVYFFLILELLNMFVVMIPLVQEKQKSFIPY